MADLDQDGDVDDTDIAIALSNYTGPRGTGKTAAQGDTDGDGDVDDSDLGTIFSAYTGPLAPPEELDADDVNRELERKDRVVIPGGTVIRGGLRIPREYTELVCLSGKRPVIVPERDQHAIEATNSRIERLHVRGIAAHSEHRDSAKGFKLRLSSKPDRYAKRVEVLDSKFINFDTGVEVVDDLPRIHHRDTREHIPGRINLIVGLNIVGPCYGDDSHSVGLYVEGLASGEAMFNAFHRCGWLVASDRNKRSHSIYSQEFGAPIDCRNNVFSEAAANAVQLRSGGDFTSNICAGNSLGPFIGGRKHRVENNVILDQVDIQDHPGYDKYDRGHGLIFGGWDHTVRRNLLARRHGSLETIPGIKGLHFSDSNPPEGNVAIDWSRDGYNFEFNGARYTEYGSNRTIMYDPGVPRFTAIDAYMSRERGEPFGGTEQFIKRCWEGGPDVSKTTISPTGDTTAQDAAIQSAAAGGHIHFAAGDHYIEDFTTTEDILVTADPGARIHANDPADGSEAGWTMQGRTVMIGVKWHRHAKKRCFHFEGDYSMAYKCDVTGDTATDADQLPVYVRQGTVGCAIMRCNIENAGSGIRVSRACHRTVCWYNTITDLYEHGAYFSQSNDCDFSHNEVRRAGGNFCKMQIDNTAPSVSVTGWRCTNNYGHTSADNGWQTNRTADASTSLYIDGPVIEDNIAIGSTGNAFRLINVTNGVYQNNTYFASTAPNNTDTRTDPDEVSTFTTETNNTLASARPAMGRSGSMFSARPDADIADEFENANPVHDALHAVSGQPRNRWQLDETDTGLTTAVDRGFLATQDGTIGSAVLRGRGCHLTERVYRKSCFEFTDAANSTVDVTGWTLPAGDFSVSFWFRSDDVSKQQYLFSHGDGSTTDYFHVLLNGSTLEFRARRGNTSISCDDVTTTFTDGSWYHVLYTLSGTTRTLYVNGVDVTNTNTDTLAAYTGTRIGGIADDSSSARFDGELQDITVYNNALTSGDATNLYAARIPAQAVSYDDFAANTAFTTSGSITLTATDHQLTVANTGSGTATTAANTLSTSDRWVMQVALNPDGGAGYKFRLQLLDSTTAVALIAFDDTTLSIDDGDGVSMTDVTPSNWDHDAEQRVVIVGDPATDTAYFWLFHVDTAANDQHAYLGSVSMASTPDRWRISVGSTNGTTTLTEPAAVFKTEDVLATMGDSISTGSPLFTSVPRHFTTSIYSHPSQFAFWYAAERYPTEQVEIVNFGKGGTGMAVVEAQREWFNHLQPRRALIMAGRMKSTGRARRKTSSTTLQTSSPRWARPTAWT